MDSLLSQMFPSRSNGMENTPNRPMPRSLPKSIHRFLSKCNSLLLPASQTEPSGSEILSNAPDGTRCEDYQSLNSSTQEISPPWTTRAKPNGGRTELMKQN